MRLPSQDFESCASAIPPPRRVYHSISSADRRALTRNPFGLAVGSIANCLMEAWDFAGRASLVRFLPYSVRLYESREIR